MTVAQLLASISSRELSEWLALFMLEAEEAEKQEAMGKAKTKAQAMIGRRR